MKVNPPLAIGATLLLVAGVLPLAKVSAHTCHSLTTEPPETPGDPNTGCNGASCPCKNAPHDHRNDAPPKKCKIDKKDCTTDEKAPRCKDDQPGLGYRTTQPLWGLWESLGESWAFSACEGEHWDGQDWVRPGETSCSTATNLDPSAPLVGSCLALGSDPNAMSGGSLVGARASTDGGATYAATNVNFVALVAVHADDNTAAVYFRDNTNQATGGTNVIATVVSIFGITGGHASEADCDQATYAAGTMEGDRARCGRDNTAVTAQYALP